MGEIVASMELENAVDRGNANDGLRDESAVRRATVNGVAGAGAAMLVLPEDVVGRLGLQTQRKVVVTYADERTEIRAVAGPLRVEVANRSMTADCTVGPPLSEPRSARSFWKGWTWWRTAPTKRLLPSPSRRNSPC